MLFLFQTPEPPAILDIIESVIDATHAVIPPEMEIVLAGSIFVIGLAIMFGPGLIKGLR